MATPNVTLPYGFLFVYGEGVTTGLYGNKATNDVFRFGTIYGVGVNMGATIVGQSVCFDSRTIVCQLAYANYPYTVIEATAVICTEFPEPEA